MSERDIVNAITKHLRSRAQCFAYKVHGGPYQQVGIPDIVGCYRGHFFALEVKQPKTMNKVTEIQRRTLAEISAAGGLASVVCSVDQVTAIFNDLDTQELP